MTPLNDFELEKVNGGTQIPYLVQEGDTIEALAKRFGCTIEDVCKWNHISDPNKISVNQKLVFKY